MKEITQEIRVICQYPGCQLPHDRTWALVPVCKVHGDAILQETMQYYQENIRMEERTHYRKIKHLTPWRDSHDS